MKNKIIIPQFFMLRETRKLAGSFHRVMNVTNGSKPPINL